MPERQCLRKLSVAPGTTAREAVALAGLQAEFPQLDLGLCRLGIFGHVVDDDRRLQQGDRVEVYRPLRNEPRERRREVAARGSTMGGLRPAQPVRAKTAVPAQTNQARCLAAAAQPPRCQPGFCCTSVSISRTRLPSNQTISQRRSGLVLRPARK